MSKALHAAVGSAVVSLCAAFTPAIAGTTPVVVALSGTSTPSGGTYTATFGSATLNAAGQVAFMNGTTANLNLYLGAPGSVQSVAINGTPAPSGGNFNAINSATLPPSINSSGKTAFVATLSGGSAARGVFVGAPGSLQTVALNGDSTPAGGTFNVFTSPVAINNAGTIAFASTLTGASGASGLFVGTPGSLQSVAVLGATTPSGGVYSAIIAAPALNASGQVAFISLNGSAQGIFAGSPGLLQTAMLQGTPTPGISGATYGTPGSNFSYNNSNQVAFSSSITLSDSTTSSAVFAGAPGSVQLVAQRNTAAPGGGKYGPFGGNFNLNSAGQVAFTSSGMTESTSTSGVFFGTPGSIQAVARQGDAAPAFGTTFASFASAIPNDAGQVAFSATLAGVGVDATNDSILVAGAPGLLQVIVREGDKIDVDPTAGIDLRTVSGSINVIAGSGGDDGRAYPFTDSGYIAYRLTFLDGSAGIFVSQVPEPASLSALALGAAFVLRRRAR